MHVFADTCVCGNRILSSVNSHFISCHMVFFDLLAFLYINVFCPLNALGSIQFLHREQEERPGELWRFSPGLHLYLCRYFHEICKYFLLCVCILFTLLDEFLNREIELQ